MMNRKEHAGSKGTAGSSKTLKMKSEEDDKIRFGRAFTGTLKDAAMAPIMKSIFVEEGIFTIRVTSLGPNLCLLEDLVFGEVEIFLEERREWWQQWFSKIVPWKPSDIDAERFAWLSVRGIPCHAWGSMLFKLIANLFGSFIKSDDLTSSRIKMEEARIFIKATQKSLINEICMVSVDDIPYKLFIQEVVPFLQSSGQLSFSKAEQTFEESSSPTEENVFEEEGGSDSDMHHSHSKLSEAHLGKDFKGEGRGSDVARPEGDLVLDIQKECENLENYYRKDDNANTAFSENSSSTPLLVSIPDETPIANNDSDNGFPGSRSIEGDIVLSDGHSVPLVGKGSEDGTHSSGLVPSFYRNSIGPFEEVESDPLSFDPECRKVGLSKPKCSKSKTRQKKRPIQNLGDRTVPSPSFYSALAPRKRDTRKAKEGDLTEVESGVDPYGSFVPCISHTDSEVIRCNNRLMSAPISETEVSRKVWNSIVNLGVVSGEETSRCIKKVEEMEKRDKLGLKGMMAISNGVP